MKRELWTVSPTLQDQGHSHEVPVEIHPHSNGRLLINMPGWDGAIDGYEEKYRKMADFLVDQDIAAVVRCGNHPIEPFDFEESCRAQIRDLTKTALAKSVEICGSPNPELYYMGFSAGASAMAASAHLFPELQSLLLVAPSQDAGREPMRRPLPISRIRLHRRWQRRLRRRILPPTSRPMGTPKRPATLHPHPPM